MGEKQSTSMPEMPESESANLSLRQMQEREMQEMSDAEATRIHQEIDAGRDPRDIEYELGGPKQFRADREIRRFRGVYVDTHPDPALGGGQSNHASSLDEIISVTNEEDASVFETDENLLQAVCFGLADEQDVTRLDLIDLVITLDP